MPYKSDKQERLMRAVAHSPSFAKKVGIPQSVGQKFEAHKAEGGTVKEATMKKIFAGKETPAEERKEKTAAKKAGMTYKAAERKFEGEKYCGGGKVKRYEDGGETEAEMIPGAAKPDTGEATFKEAFAIAKARGADNFTWKGKKYTTDVASSTPKASTSADRSTRSGGATAGKMVSQAQASMPSVQQASQDDETKSVAERAKAARERARSSNTGTDTRSVSERIRSALGFAQGGTTALPINDDMGSDRTYDSKKAMARRMPEPPVKKAIRRSLDIEPDMGSAAYKKGGSVRGVGIAQRGFGCGGKVKR